MLQFCACTVSPRKPKSAKLSLGATTGGGSLFASFLAGFGNLVDSVRNSLANILQSVVTLAGLSWIASQDGLLLNRVLQNDKLVDNRLDILPT